MFLQVFADLWVDQHQILMATVATALLDIGYEIEVIICQFFLLLVIKFVDNKLGQLCAITKMEYKWACVYGTYIEID